MSYCPRPAAKTKTAFTTPAKKTVNKPAPRTEACGPSSSTIITGGGSSTSNTIYVPGPAGPAGPIGPAGINGIGFFWRGSWGTGASYEKQELGNPSSLLSDVVSNEGCTFICIQSHTADAMSEPHHADFVGATNWTTYWSLLADKGSAGGLAPEEQTFFESLQNDIFDWVKNASIGELILAGAGVAGVIWAGSKIVDSLTDDGQGDGTADQRYTGTPGLVSAGYDVPDIKEVIAAYCNAAQIDFDVSLLPDAPCEFTVGSSQQIRTIFEQLSLSFQFDMVDTGGILKFIPRTTNVAKTISDEDLGFDNSRISVPYSTKRFQGIDLPKSVTLKYPASDLDYNTFTQTANLFTYPEGQDISLETPVTLTNQQAKKIVEVSLINSHLQRTQRRFVTSYEHIDIEPADVISNPSMGLIRVNSVKETSEGQIEIICTDAGAELAVQASNQQAVIPRESTNIPVEIGYSQAFFIDPGVMDENDIGVRMYAAVHGYDKPGWPGASIYVSENNGATYELVSNVYKEATYGLVATAIPNVDYRVWDETSTISVVLKVNDLTSVSYIDVLNSKNRCMIGQEVIGFRNAVLTGPKTYTLSGLLRGRQGTEQFVNTHVNNELFVLLDDALVRMEYDLADRDTIKKYKVVTIGSTIDKVDGEDVMMISNNTLAWPVLNPKILKTGNDYNVSYNGRNRYDNMLKDYSTTNNDVTFGGFGILVMDGANVKKSYTTTSENWIYTSAMQIADFGSNQPNITIKIAQLSQNRGAGYSVTINS